MKKNQEILRDRKKYVYQRLIQSSYKMDVEVKSIAKDLFLSVSCIWKDYKDHKKELHS